MLAMSVLFALWQTDEAEARIHDRLINGARQCTQHFARQERRHGIPVHLLAAISSTESGRWSDKLNMVVPWPWTINVEGQGYYFDSKSEAIAAVRDHQAQGKTSIDIGCMQVNLRHHPKAFRSLSDAFDPASNVAYAAKFLRSNYDDSRSWIKATAAYHSKTPKYGNKYLKRIEKSWNNIVSKIRTARERSGEGNKRRYAVKVGDKSSSGRPVQMASLREELSKASAPRTALPIRNVDRLGASQKSQRVKLKTIELSSTGNKKMDESLIIKPKVSNRALAKMSAQIQVENALETQANSLFRPDSSFLIQPDKQRLLKQMTATPADDKKSAKKSLSKRKVVFVE